MWKTCVLSPGPVPSDCAAWVQAWGSIGAILVTALAVLWSHHLQVSRQRQIEQDALTQRVRSLHWILRSLLIYCQSVIDAGDRPLARVELENMGLILATLQSSIDKLDQGRFDKDVHLNGWVASDLSVRLLQREVQRQLTPPSFLEPARLRSLAQQITPEMGMIVERLKADIESRGASVIVEDPPFKDESREAAPSSEATAEDPLAAPDSSPHGGSAPPEAPR